MFAPRDRIERLEAGEQVAVGESRRGVRASDGDGMIELLAVFFVCRDVGRTAREKGRSVFAWRALVIFSWVAFEASGFVVGLLLFQERGPLFAYGCGIVGAMLGLIAVSTVVGTVPPRLAAGTRETKAFE